MAEDRLTKMKEIMARAQTEKEAKAKEEAERAQRETEAKGAERAQVGQELAASEQELAGLETQLGEAETLAGQMAELPEEARGEFDAELIALRSEATALRGRVTDLNERKQKLDAELGSAATAEEVAEATPVESAAEGVADQAAVTEAEPETKAETEGKPEPTPEESAKALNELSYSMVFHANSVEDKIQDDFSVEKFIAKYNKRTLKVKKLQETLKYFEGKDPSELSSSEEIQLKQAMSEAAGEVYYDIHAPGMNKPYDQKWPTTLDIVNRTITYFLDDDRDSLRELQAEVAVLNEEDTPDRVGRIDLIKIKEELESLTAADKEALLKKLYAAISKGEEAAKRAEIIIQKNKEALSHLEPTLRASEQTLHNTLLDLDKLSEHLREKFASVLK